MTPTGHEFDGLGFDIDEELLALAGAAPPAGQAVKQEKETASGPKTNELKLPDQTIDEILADRAHAMQSMKEGTSPLHKVTQTEGLLARTSTEPMTPSETRPVMHAGMDEKISSRSIKTNVEDTSTLEATASDPVTPAPSNSRPEVQPAFSDITTSAVATEDAADDTANDDSITGSPMKTPKANQKRARSLDESEDFPPPPKRSRSLLLDDIWRLFGKDRSVASRALASDENDSHNDDTEGDGV